MGGRKRIVLWLTVCLLSVAGTAAGISNVKLWRQVAEAATISWGSTGGTVEEIQSRLRNWGFYDGNVDGIFGQGTYEAVVAFQRANNLTPDGIVGDATLAALGINSAGNVDNDVYLLASAIYGEGRGEPYEGQVAIGAVILNRVRDSRFPNTIAGVIYQNGAFDAVRDGQINLVPNQIAINAAQDALAGWDPTNGALYYWNPATATSRWIWSVPITTRIGNHVFGTK